MSITDWITAGSLALLVVIGLRAAIATCRIAEAMIEQSHPEQVTRNIYRKLNNIMGITEDIQTSVASLHDIMGEIAEYASEVQGRVNALEAKLAEAEANAADPGAVEALKAEIAEFKAQADAMVASLPTPPAVPDVTPVETPVEDAPVE